MNWGAFSGGAAQGISRGISDSRTMQRLEREKKEAELEDAWRKEQKALTDRYFSTQVETPQDGTFQDQQQPGQVAPQSQVEGGETNQVQQQVQGGGSSGEGQQAQARKPAFNSMADAINFATEGAKINMKYGKSSPADFVNLMKIKQTLQKENMEEAIGRLHGGDFQGALSAYNESGDDRVEYKGAPQQGVFVFAGQKIPTVIATVVDKNGQERTINTAQIMASKIGLDKTIDLLHKDMQLKEHNRHNTTMEGVARDRASKVGVGSNSSKGGGKGKWVQNEDGEWEFLQAGETTQGMPKETIKVNEDGTTTAYDPVSGTARTIYTPEKAEAVARTKAEAWAKKVGDEWTSLTPSEERIQAKADEIKAQLLEQSKRQPRTGSAPSGPAGGLGKTSDNNVGNNVGGMRPNGQSTGFQSFGTVEEGLKAVDDNLKSYGANRGIDTLAGVISTWSPESDGNDTKTLIENASRVTGLKPDQKIDLKNPAVRAVIAAAIIRQEGSQSYLTGIGKGKQQQAGAPPVKSPVTGGLGGDAVRKPEQQDKSTPSDKKSIWTDPNSPLAGSLDFGAMVGKPIAAIGEMYGDTVSTAVDLIQQATKRRVSDDDIKQIVAYAKEVNDPEAVANAFMSVAGNPAKNTEKYMQRTSSKNLNQYFR